MDCRFYGSLLIIWGLFMKTLVVAEKPSVGRDIARVLKCGKRGEGFLFSDEYIISWAVGHLVTLCDPEDYDKELKKWRIESLPIIPSDIKTKVITDTKKQFNVLKKLMNDKDVSEIVCATDSGREGELIFRYIYNLVKCKKPFKRLWISSMTDSSIKDGFANLKDGSEYDNLYLSAKCRSEADWLVGINASRAFTLKYDALLSIGRVQTPTLAILAERQKEINEFVPKTYWEINAVFDGYKSVWIDLKENDSKIFGKEKAFSIADEVKGKQGGVTSVENKENKQPPPFLYDLTELQRECNRKYSFSAKQTLGIAQDLYEKRKLITYPRTDSRYLSDDMIPKIKSTLSKINSVEQYREFSEYVVGLEKLPLGKRIIDNSKITDHHAIIPTDTKINIMALSDAEFKVFDLIVRRFLAVFYPQYIYNTTKIITTVDVHNFITKGTTIIQEGWTVLNIQSRNDKKEEDTLPNVKKGDSVMNEASEAVEKQTVPPKMYNEANLLSAMENAGRFVDDESLKEQLKEGGLGTPATRAAIIERLLQVGYIQRKGKTLIPTEKGMKLIEVVPPELKSPETTGKWEKGLSSISKGKMGDERFMGSIKRYVNYLVEQSKTSIKRVDFPKDERNLKKGGKRITVLGKCPKCENGEILENSKSFYCTNWKRGCKFSLWKNCIENYGKTITAKDAKTLIKERKIINSDITLPQTGEKCAGDIILKDDNSGSVEIVNLQRKREN